MERVTRLLFALTAVLLLVGLGLRIAPTPATASPHPLNRPVAPPPEINHSSDLSSETAAAVIAGNPFSISRSAPRVRYTPPDLNSGTRELPRPQDTPRPRVLRLLGTVVGPAGTAALIQVGSGKVEIYQVGDVVSGRRVVAVAESTVVLQGAAGQLTLRLQPGAPPHR